MARVKTFTGLSDFSKNLARLGAIAEVDRVFKTSLYDGAGIIADAVRSEIEALPTGREYGTPENPATKIIASQKRGLQDGFGLSAMKKLPDWGWQISAGFDGYNSTITQSYPNGQPNAMIAASIEGGTSFRRKNPFITRALRKSRDKANAAMKKTAEAAMKETMEVK